MTENSQDRWCVSSLRGDQSAYQNVLRLVWVMQLFDLLVDGIDDQSGVSMTMTQSQKVPPTAKSDG
jgi:hypothetical protein